MEVILLERVAKLGQMGETVRVQGRLCPQLPAAARQGAARHRRPTRSASRRSAPSSRPATSSAAREAEAVGEKLDGQSFIIIRQAGETGAALRLGLDPRPRRDADRRRLHGRTASRSSLNTPIKTLGLHTVPVHAASGGRGEGDDQRRPQPRGGRAPGARRERPHGREETNLDDLGLEVGAALAEAGAGDEAKLDAHRVAT